MDTPIKKDIAFAVALAIVIGSGFGIYALTNTNNVPDVVAVELTAEEKAQMKKKLSSMIS